MREINDVGDCGIATVCRNSKIPWSGVRRLPLPDDALPLFNYSCPTSVLVALRPSVSCHCVKIRHANALLSDVDN